MNSQLLACIYVFIGGGIGAISRYLAGIQVAKLWGTDFPYGTLLINILGSFLIGVVASYFTLFSNTANQDLRLFLIVGILGGFTTFSSFSLETLILLQRGELLLALGYILLSVFISLMMVFFGYEFVKWKFS